MATLRHTLKYKEPRIRDYNGDTSERWAVYWYVFDTQTSRWARQVKWISLKLNARDRYKEGERLVTEIKQNLKRGYTGAQSENIPKISEALDIALNFKSAYLSNRTLQSYENIVEKLKRWVKKNCPEMRVTDFTKYDANRFLSELFVKRRYAAKTINCYTQYLHTLFAQIGESYQMAENPFKKKKLKEAVPEIVVWDEKSKQKISEYLKANEPEFFIIVLLVYHCFLRPNEIRLLRVKDFDLTQGVVKVNASTSKTNIFKAPTLSPQLIELLEPVLKNKAPALYIFSKDFKPGLKPISRNIISQKFAIIRKNLNLSNDLKLYSFKHTGNSELIECGVNMRDLQIQNGHTSIAMTEKYIFRLNEKANINIQRTVKRL